MAREQQVSGPVAEVHELLELCSRGAGVYGRGDLSAALSTARRALHADFPAGRPVDRPLDRVAAVMVGTVRDALGVVLRTCSALELDAAARREAVEDPRRPARLQAEADRASAALHEAQVAARDWPQALGEGFATLGSDAEFALRARAREVVALTDECIDAGDPGRDGRVVEGWLRERLSYEAGAVHAVVREGADRTSEAVAAACGEPVENLAPSVSLLDPAELVAGLTAHRAAVPGSSPLAARLVMVLMPAYSGVMMTLILSEIAGLHMPAWMFVACAATAALAMGGAALSGDRRRQLERRRGEARSMARSLVDAYQITLSKHVHDALRTAQTSVRTSASASVAARIEGAGREFDARRRAVEDLSRSGAVVAELTEDLASVRVLRERALRLMDVGATVRLEVVPLPRAVNPFRSGSAMTSMVP